MYFWKIFHKMGFEGFCFSFRLHVGFMLSRQQCSVCRLYNLLPVGKPLCFKELAFWLLLM